MKSVLIKHPHINIITIKIKAFDVEINNVADILDAFQIISKWTILFLSSIWIFVCMRVALRTKYEWIDQVKRASELIGRTDGMIDSDHGNHCVLIDK